MSPSRISVVTACRNAEKTVAATVRSVLEQDDKPYEYFVFDGGSTDGTLDELAPFESRFSRLQIAEDEGPYHAIASAIEQASGDILAWINADDLYFRWTFSVVRDVFDKFPEVDWIVGLPAFLNERGQCIKVSGTVAGYPRRFIRNGWYRGHLGGYLQQESMFWRRSLWERSGGFDLSLRLAADFKLWTEFAKHSDLVAVASPLAAFRRQPGVQRSSRYRDVYETEVQGVCEGLPSPPAAWNALAGSGIHGRALARMARWSKARVIAYSKDRSAWSLSTLRRPISRASMADLMLEQTFR